MKNPLSKYGFNNSSQFGEDGVVQRIFEILPKQDEYWCVEFGAWDGQYLSNTHNLVANHNWHGVFIEGNKKKFPDLQATYKDMSNAYLINKLVNFEGSDKLDDILRNTQTPLDVDLLSIDIDGNDLHVWEAVKDYVAKLVIIEFNPTIPSDIEFVQEKNVSCNQGNSLLSLVKLGREKGYELIATTQCNGFFIRKEFYELFKFKDNSIGQMWDTEKAAPRVFQLFDGTLVLSEEFKLIWVSKYVDKVVGRYDLQKLPESQRYFSDSTSNFWRGLYLELVSKFKSKP